MPLALEDIVDVGCLIIGGGPAALAPLVAASREGRLTDLLSQGVAVVERSDSIGVGNIGSYVIYSDSTADSFLTVVKDHRDPRLSSLWSNPLCARLRSVEYGPVSLADAAALQRRVGRVLHRSILNEGGQVLVKHEALFARQTAKGWRTRVRCVQSNQIFDIRSRSVVIGTGGYQPTSRLYSELVAGVPLLPRFEAKVVQSDEILARGGLETIDFFIAGRPDAKVVIVGGSTSAVAVADLLVRERGDRWKPGAIKIMHRSPVRIFYQSIEDAHRNAYKDFGPHDICPVTGLVYRLAGLRHRSKELIVRVLGIGAPRSEHRVDLYPLDKDDVSDAQRILHDADLIVAALGYRPRGLPLFDREGQSISLSASEAGGRLVDDGCRILDKYGEPLDGVFGIGLASGFELDAAMGGEPSFRGQANGLWLWQNDIGLRIARSVLDRGRTAGVAEPPYHDVSDAPFAPTVHLSHGVSPL